MSATEPSVRDISAQDRRKLDELLAAFHQSWEAGRLDAAVADLPPDLPYRLAAVTGLAAIDLEMRWQHADKARVEEYLQKYPELGTVDNVSIELLLAEYFAQERFEATPDLDAFLARFPQQADDLRRLIGLAKSPRLSAVRNKPSSSKSLHGQQTDETPQLPEHFDRYHILKRLGHGGMGTVYLAHDTKLDRKVALKVPKIAPGSNSENLERFYREARATATITHPNLCPLYDVGEINGTPYLTMAYIEGWPLSKFIRADKLLPQFGVATVVRIVAQAIEEAHKRGVIHRDLKPGNIMINKRGEPIVMDFGLARWVNADKEDVRLTRSGAILGAPVYMSPEQVYGDVEAMGPGCDVYSLGVILYEMLTARLPFEGPTTAVLAKTLIQPPQPPSAYRPDVDPRLEAICLKAMAKKISERYASMAELAAALTEYIRAERQTQTLTSLSNTKIPDNGSLSALSGSVPTVGSSKSGQRKKQASGKSKTVAVPPYATQTQIDEESDVLEVEDVAVPSASAVPLAKPRSNSRILLFAGLIGAATMAALLLVGLMAWLFWPHGKPEPPPQPGPEGTIQITLADAPKDVVVFVDGEAVPPDRLTRPLALKPGQYKVEVKADKYEPWKQTVEVVRGHNPPLEVTLRPKEAVVVVPPPPKPEPKEPVGELLSFGKPDHQVERVAISHDGKFALSGGFDGTVRYWDLATGHEIRSINAHISAKAKGVRYVVFSEDDKQALSCGDDKRVCLWDLATGQLVKEYAGHNDVVWIALFTPDGKYVVTGAGNNDPNARQFERDTGMLVKTFKNHTKAINSLAVSPDGKRLVTASWDSTLRVWDMDDASELHTFKAGSGNFSTVAFLPDGRRVVAANGSKVQLYNVVDFKDKDKDLPSYINGQTQSVWFVAVSPGGHRLLTSGQDKYFCLWDIESGKLLDKYTGHTDSVPCVVWTPDGTRFVSGSKDMTIRVWAPPRNLYDPPPLPASKEAAAARLLQQPTTATRNYTEQVSFTADGKRAVWCGDDKLVHVWDMDAGKESLKFDKHTAGVRTFALLSDGQRVLSASYDKTVRLWNLNTGNEIRRFTNHADRVQCVAVTPDGKRAVSAGDDKTVRVWEVDSARELKKMEGHEKSIFAVAVTPDNQEAISGSMDKTIRRWNLDAGKEIAKWTAPGDVHTVAVSPNGGRVLTGGKDRNVNLWDRESGELLASFVGHTNTITCVRFSRDGRWALSSSDDKTVRLWNVQTGQEMARFAGCPAAAKGVAFSPDAKYALICGADTSVRLWTLPEFTAPLPGQKTVSSARQ